METVSIETTQNIRISYKLAGLLDRILAFLLDMVIIVSYLVITSLIGGLIFQVQSMAFYVVNSVIAFLYLLVSEVSMNGQTLGKKAQNIRVVKLDGSKPSGGAYLLRWIMAPVDFSLSGGIAIATITLTKNGQRLGDLLAGTTVIKDQASSRSMLEKKHLLQRVEEDYQPRYPQAAQLSEQEVQLIRRCVKVFLENDQRQPLILMKEKMEARLQVSSDEPALRFLNTLARDYTYYATRTAEAAL